MDSGALRNKGMHVKPGTKYPSICRYGLLPLCLLWCGIGLGECLNTADDPNIVENLRTMRVVGTDHTGAEQTFKDQQADELHLLVTALMAADFLERRGQSLQPGDLISVGALSGNPRNASDAAGSGNRDPEWSNLHADSPAKHVSYYIGDRILTVTANFR